uniref:Histone-lysine N-methyltransferase SETMAR n=1 Tax=Caenorhabditis japonica TaxID=281687 RepID=A0A8R1E6Y2_CAEJA
MTTLAKKGVEDKKTNCELDIEVLPHPPYSPDLAPTDFHLFHPLQDNLRGKMFDDRKHLETSKPTWMTS